jgi:hypothetical protein
MILPAAGFCGKMADRHASLPAHWWAMCRFAGVVRVAA